jgi:cholest-4-en-3-one 26-monooxygenase
MTHATDRSLAGPEVMDPEYYARHGYPHETWTRLRQHDPVHFYGHFDYPFWLLSRRAEIVEVSRQPLVFSNQPRFQIVVGSDYGSDDEREPETMIHMDPPRHRAYRRLLADRFTPRAVDALEGEVGEIVNGLLDELVAEVGLEGECNFVDRIAAPMPIGVISWLLDAPREDWRKLFRMTNAVVVPADPEYKLPGESPHETRLRATTELYAYFGALAEGRRGGDRDDLVTVLTRSEVSGKPLEHHELVSFYLLLVAAGNETTRNSISNGMLAFLENPDQWQRFVEDPSLDRSASEEILRWTTPVVQMARTATEDYELAGRKIRKGDTLAMFYASANRDEAVYDAPFEFRIDRHPNPHLSFGVGEHLCMGAHLARLELRVLFRLLAERLLSVEQAGEVERMQSANVGGAKSLPIRYALCPRSSRGGA